MQTAWKGINRLGSMRAANSDLFECVQEQERIKMLLNLQQEQNKELERARDVANRAAQLKSHFLSNMSHEIR